MTKELSATTVRQLLDYRDGLLFWRERPIELFGDKRTFTAWNRRFAGKAAGTIANYKSGKRRKTVITINGASEQYLAARLVWAWHHGEWPIGLVDHEDGDTLNDRIGNLRDTTPTGNSKNMRVHVRNTSGVTGVCWNKRLGKWSAQIVSNRVTSHLGVFTRLDDAVLARKAAERELGFHPNHGRPAHV